MNSAKIKFVVLLLPIVFIAGSALAGPEFDVLTTPSKDNLSGKCADEDHEEFYNAKDFAYHSSGLDYDIDRARIWALRYNETHACNTISEFITRFNLIAKLAYGSDGFDLDNNLSKIYALQWAEVITSDEAQYNLSLVPALKSFLRSSDGLNISREQAADFSKKWVEKRQCGNIELVNQMSARFKQEYSFAYSSSGLDMSPAAAYHYAEERIKTMTSCGELFRF